MKRLVVLIACSGLSAALASGQAPGKVSGTRSTASPAKGRNATWMRSFSGKDSSELTNDPRFLPFLVSTFGSTPLPFTAEPFPEAVQTYFGPPDPVSLVNGRYVVASSCAPQFCLEKVFLWIDTADAAESAAAIVTVGAKLAGGERDAQGQTSIAHLWLVTPLPEPALKGDAPFLVALRAWLIKDVNPELSARSNSTDTVNSFTLVGSPGGETTKLEAAFLDVAPFSK